MTRLTLSLRQVAINNSLLIISVYRCIDRTLHERYQGSPTPPLDLMEEVGADKQGCHAALSSSPFYKTEGATAITTASNSTTPHVQYDESTTLLPPYHPNPPSCSSGLPLDDDPAQKELKRQPQPQHQASTHINHNDDHCGPPRFSRDALIQKITSLYSNGKKRQYSHGTWCCVLHVMSTTALESSFAIS